jgi:micrococcal nuclease
LLAAFAVAAPSLASSESAGHARAKQRAVVDHVADGDTIKVVLGGREEYVRFIGIDTPELYPSPDCGATEASAAMDRFLQPGDVVKLVRDRTQGNRDQYGRLLRYVEFGGHDLGEKQLRKGWARVYVFDDPFKRLGVYDRAEARARNSGRGVWGACRGG